MLAAIENPYTQIIAHPTGRMIMRRDEVDYDMEKILDACAKYERRYGMQFVSRPAGPQRCVSTDVQTAWRQGSDLHGRAKCAASSIYSLRRSHRVTRLAG